MRIIPGIFLISLFAFGCENEKVPDVSNINIDLKLVRFEQEFFSIDTTNIDASLQNLYERHPVFLNDFLVNILGIPLLSSADEGAELAIRQFIRDYKPVKDTSDIVFRSFDKIASEVKTGLQFTKYYFPDYKTPQQLITFIGPLDAFYEGSIGSYGDVITNAGLAVGLPLHMGKNYSIYQSETGQRLYPTYISRRFEPGYIPVNCIKNIIDDMFPEKVADKPLIEQMIEKGKRMYVLDQLLPRTADTLKIGFTGQQLEGCYENEASIWNLFLQNNLLYSIDPALNKNYIQDGPKTEELGPASPGFIGLFVGWQIAKKYMSDHEDTSLTQLMLTDNKTIFQESKYKPR